MPDGMIGALALAVHPRPPGTGSPVLVDRVCPCPCFPLDGQENGVQFSCASEGGEFRLGPLPIRVRRDRLELPRSNLHNRAGMAKRIAVKSLTDSDLTFFAWHFRNRPAGNQKAINLNKNPFVNVLFPSLPSIAAAQAGTLKVDLSIYGPGASGLHHLVRKVVKGGTYKNWRLNGEFIHNPDDEPARYNPLRAGDIAIMEFSSVDGVTPRACRLFLLAAAVPEDRPVLERVQGLLGGRSMIAIERFRLETAITEVVPGGHPLEELLLESALEEAAAGNEAAREELVRRRPTKVVQRAELLRAREAAERTGVLGEELVNGYLSTAPDVEDYVWASEENAISPHDFVVLEGGLVKQKVEVKSTAGDFDRPFHISTAELRDAAGDAPYLIYRVSEVSEEGGKLKVSRPINDLAVSLLRTLDGLPDGVVADGVSIEPRLLQFGPEILLSEPAEDDE